MRDGDSYAAARICVITSGVGTEGVPGLNVDAFRLEAGFLGTRPTGCFFVTLTIVSITRFSRSSLLCLCAKDLGGSYTSRQAGFSFLSLYCELSEAPV